MERDTSVAEETSKTSDSGGEVVNVAGGEWVGSDLAIFAREVANLAGLGESRVADGGFAAEEGIDVAQGRRTVAVGGDWEGVEVVEEWTSTGWKAGERDSELDTGS